jgi:vancomycin permeability regulator SanA
VVFGVAPSVTSVRHLLSAPLIVHDHEANGDGAYVMQGGLASEERLRAAADLFHMGRVPRIYLLRDDHHSYYSKTEDRSMTRTEWMVAYLAWLGVPAERVTLIDDDGHRWFGSLHEADRARAALPPDVKRLVVVTSPVHTRRSGLAFRRRLGPAGVSIVTFAAIDWSLSAEAFAPLWLEYLKLAAYAIVA